MRTFVTVIAIAALTAVSASAQTSEQVTSKNAVGFVKVEVPSNQLTIVSVPFNTLNEKGVYTLDELIGTNMFANWSATVADEVLLWTGESYSSAFLNDDGWADPNVNWKWCYLDGSGNPQPAAENSAYDVSAGQAFWIRNRHSDKQLYFMGEVPSATSTTIPVTEGLVMIANPYPVTKTLDELITTNSGAYANWSATVADEILFWSGEKYYSAFLNDAGWADPAVNWKWCYLGQDGNPKACADNEAYTLSPGQGIWYRSRGGAFDWNTVKPYDWP